MEKLYMTLTGAASLMYLGEVVLRAVQKRKSKCKCSEGEAA